MKCFFLFINLILSIMETLKKNDLFLHKNKDVNSIKNNDKELSYDEPFLIFLYYERNDYNCPLCVLFKNYLIENLKSVKIKIRKLNFIDDVELGSRFLIYKFPAFIVRYKNKSYVLEHNSPEELFSSINTNSWMKIEPVRSIIDVNSLFVIIFSKANIFFFYILNYYYIIVNYVPDSVIKIIVMGVILFLLYSIFDVLNTPDVKIKKE